MNKAGMEYRVRSLEAGQTRMWGTRLGERLQGGDVVALRGDLGAGKTAFAQGVGEALGVTGPMTSPTFTLRHEYCGTFRGTGVKTRLVHMDLYRLRHPEEVEVIGIEDALAEDSVCLIEWPEIAEDYLPEDCLEVEILGSGESPREIIFRSIDHQWVSRLGLWLS